MILHSNLIAYNFHHLKDIFLHQVHILSSFILNGVCVRWRGWLDLERLEGISMPKYHILLKVITT